MSAAAPFLAAVVILAAAGGAKLWRPDDTARALTVAGLPSHRLAVRAVAALEVMVAVAALARPSALTGALVGAAYAGFSGFVAVALWRGWPLTSCGCFGRPDSKPGYAHLAVDLGAAGAAAWWASDAPPSLGAVLAGQPWHGGPLLLETAVIATLAYLVWDDPLARARRALR